MSEKNILIIAPAWVGDVIMSQSLYKLLKQQDPRVYIDVMALAWAFPLLKCMPEVREALLMPIGHGKFQWHERYRLGKSLRSRGYHQAIVLPNSWKSALIPWFAKIPQRTGWKGEMRYGLLNDMRTLDQKRYPLLVERYMALGVSPKSALPEIYPYPQLQVFQQQIELLFGRFPLLKTQKAQGKILALCPGAQYGPAKNWPEEYFAEVAKMKMNEGWAVWLFGSNNDLPRGEKIQQITHDRCVNLVGKTTLDEVIGLLSLADAVISNDSGLMHLAAALNVPLVAVYGSSSPQFTPPLSPQAKVLRKSLACSPCFKRQCRYGHYRCLREITPSLVADALAEME